MTAFNDLTKSMQILVPPNEQWEFVAFLGNASGVVEADKKNNVWVIRHDKTELTVRNTRVPNQAKLLVVVGYDKSSSDSTLLQVLRQVNAYLDPPYPPVANHAEISHKRWGYDPVWITHDQILPGLAYPKSNTGMIVSLRGFNYFLNGYHTKNNGDVDFSSHIPSSGARWVLAEIAEDKTITLRDGDTLASRELLTPENIPHPASDKASCFALKCYFGQLRIIATEKDSDIFDTRFTGVASGGLATSVDWSSITGKPETFPPDLTYTDPIYIRRWSRSGTPDANDDSSEGYRIDDHWNDSLTDDIYVCKNNDEGAAVWILLGSGSSGGGGATSFYADGRLVVSERATSPILITQPTTISEWTMYLEELGDIYGQTVLDVLLRRVGSADVSIFTDLYTDNRPVMSGTDTDNLASFTPLITDFVSGDVLIMQIAEVADGASSVTLAGSSSTGGGGGGSSSITVSDGTTTVGGVSTIVVENAEVVDDGGGQVTIKGAPILDRYTLPCIGPDSNVGFTIQAGSGYGVWYQSSGAANDEAVWNIILPAGTYNLLISDIKDTNRGVYHWYLDGVEVGTYDSYGTPLAIVGVISGGVVSTGGSVEIKIKMESKNPSSSAYYATIFGLWIQKTA
jgi:hypothetical protein